MAEAAYPFAINTNYNTLGFIEAFRNAYERKAVTDFVQRGSRLLHIPFSCAAFDNFLQPNSSRVTSPNSDSEDCFTSERELVDKAEAEARRLPFERKSNDLFTFSQSVDVANLSITSNETEAQSSFLVKLRSFLLTDVLPWLEKLTGAPLEKGKVDFTSSIYSTNDVLLCHDDELENRRIAFVWYLVPEDWDEQAEGGCLDLFSCQPEDQLHTPVVTETPTIPINPWKIIVSLPPRRNRLVFFEPSAYSFHQVAENLGVRDRLSLHGWFHGPPNPRPVDKCHPTPIPLVSPVHVEEELVYRWISPIYLDMKQQSKIRRRFVKSSEIQLANFLKTDEWSRLCDGLASVQQSTWIKCGPFNRKNFDVLQGVGKFDCPEDAAPDVIRQLYRLFRSEAMLVILSDLTGIQLHPEALVCQSKEQQTEPSAKRPHVENGAASSSTTPESHMAKISDPQVRRWNIGSYTLLADSDVLDTNWRLECTLHLGGYGPRETDSIARPNGIGDSVKQWPTSWGGHIVYIADGEKDELLSVIPSNNSLTLVYAGPGTANFVKYINHSARPASLVPASHPSINELPASCYDLSVVYHEPPSSHESESVDEESSEGNEEEEEDDEEAPTDDESDCDQQSEATA